MPVEQFEIYMRVTCANCGKDGEGWMPAEISSAGAYLRSNGWHIVADEHADTSSLFNPHTDTVLCKRCARKRGVS